MSKKINPLAIENLACSLGGQNVLSDINLDIKKGKFYSIIGPNGSGKTTLLKAIAVGLQKDFGNIFLEGRDISKISGKEIAKKLAYVPQNISTDFNFTVLDYVLMGRYPYIGLFQSESREDMEHARMSMDITNIWNIREKNINEISGGERQRVLIARALAQNTDIMLLDEPISHLDIHHQIELMDTLHYMVLEKGTTVITVLHDLNIAAQYSDHIIILNKGNIVSSGAPNVVINPKTLQDVYGLNVEIFSHPDTGRPFVIPTAGKKLQKKAL